MNILSRLASALSLLRGGKTEPAPAPDSEAFLVFASTGEVIQAERVLKAGGLGVRVMAPPPALRTGCDMVLVVPLLHAFRAVALLEEQRLAPLQLTPAGEALLEPVSLFQTKDYGEWLMVRAANMKLPVEKASGRIVNVSGGGCPDVPYLAALLTGKNIREAHLVREHGQTLCGYALYLAAQELLRQHGLAHGGNDA
ncbi:MAG: DUF3343 domain-containing protein [Deltaproteobacteria bacterium]|jgi:hypothetical protein|nr:DUF3343 domain-containing protein [Deltaproteobacteria bacterium]